MDRELEAMCADWTAALAGLDAVAARRHPGGNEACWNAQQVVEHLVLTYRSSSAAMRVRLEKGRPTQARPKIRQRVARLFVLKLGYLPRGQRASAEVTPRDGLLGTADGEELALHLSSALGEMDDLIGQCRAAFGKGPMASHFALGPLSAEQWRRFHVVHGRHHLRQLSDILHTVRNL